MTSSLANLFHSSFKSKLNISSSKHLHISIFSFTFSSRVNCYNSSLHYQLSHPNKYQRLLLQRKMSDPVEFIKPSELAEIIKDTNQTPGKDYLIVDVRDGDYEGGNIPNSINSPSKKFHDHVNELISKYNQVPKIVFTCALSQVRGPKCARIYKENTGNTSQKIQVLQGGIGEWQKQNKDDPKLVENYNPEYWEEDY
uniref:CDC25-like phosphatase YCH1 n=1 Tax=Anthurium amnicola TaxID=1678845 RepID=A0A1D1YWM9_9ARAE